MTDPELRLREDGPDQFGRRRLLTGAGACAFCAATGVGAGWLLGRRSHGPPPLVANRPTRTKAARRRAQPEALFAVDTKQPVVGLSFDDGPDPKYTPAVLQLLEQYGFRATFFEVGVNIAAYPELLRQQLAAGHEIANHTFSHPQLQTMLPPAVAAEIDHGSDAITKAGAPRSDLFRPPRGFTDTIINVLAGSESYRTVFWSECLEEHLSGRSLRDGVDRVLDRIGTGSIVLAHDGGHILAPGAVSHDRSRTVEALPLLFRGLKDRGLRGVSIADLLGLTS